MLVDRSPDWAELRVPTEVKVESRPSLPVLVTMTVRKLVIVERPGTEAGSTTADSDGVTAGAEEGIDAAPITGVDAAVERAVVGGAVELAAAEVGEATALELELEGSTAWQDEAILVEVSSCVMGLVTNWVETESTPCVSSLSVLPQASERVRANPPEPQFESARASQSLGKHPLQRYH